MRAEDVMERQPDVRKDDVVIVEVAGEFDASNLSRFCARMDELADEGARRVVLDLAELRFADSEMLGQLLKVRERFRGEGGDVVLLRPGRLVTRTLNVLGLDELLTICRTKTEAIRALLPGAEGTTEGAADDPGDPAWRTTRVT